MPHDEFTIKQLTCITCPIGCLLSVTTDEEGKPLHVSGNGCKRGRSYAISELTHPVRTLTTTLRVGNRDGKRVSVKTDRPIPRERLIEAICALSAQAPCAPIRVGDILLPDLLGVCDLVATEEIE